jgi:hypothetical protein
VPKGVGLPFGSWGLFYKAESVHSFDQHHPMHWEFQKSRARAGRFHCHSNVVNTYLFYKFLQRLDKRGDELNSSIERVTARFGGISPEVL